MADYSSEIASLKQKLGELSDYSADLENIYRKAIESKNASFKTAANEVKAQAEKQKEEASTKKYTDEYNFNQYLEGRGLSNSGEAVQAKLNRDMTEANTLNNADAAATEAIAGLISERDGDIADLELEKDKKKLDYMSKQKNTLSEAITKLEDSSEKNEDNDSPGGEETVKNDYTPRLSALSLAKTVYDMYVGNDGKLSAYESSKIKEYLQDLAKANGLSDSYVRDVAFALKMKGYDPDIMSSLSSQEQARIVDEAKALGESAYKKLKEQVYGRISRVDASIKARQEQARAVLTKIYTNVYNNLQFETLAKQAGYTNTQISQFYEWLGERDTEKFGKIEYKALS
ncbi:MAG TPA: hypothetical protein PLT66_07850 [Bacillota bacterium]|nr:hypothetical protein [Bacillota bacterium]